MSLNREEILKMTKAQMVQYFFDQVAELDQRRQAQIQNQVATINRVMQGWRYDEEMRKLHEELADTQTRLDLANREIKRLKGELIPSAHNVRRL